MFLIQIVTLAEKIGVHRNTIRNWVKTGKIVARPGPGKGLLLSPEELARLCDEYQLDAKVLKPREVAGQRPRQESSVQEEAQDKNNFHNQREAYMSEGIVGSVMVIGGGIAGIQASLDLADSGYYVYLVEKSAGIGGKMSQLDKTYPTNDCAM
jgi:NADPH-dependent 2,4-dienoyl-CoA reductase/sulfur reductase-like enzyme